MHTDRLHQCKQCNTKNKQSASALAAAAGVVVTTAQMNCWGLVLRIAPDDLACDQQSASALAAAGVVVTTAQMRRAYDVLRATRRHAQAFEQHPAHSALMLIACVHCHPLLSAHLDTVAAGGGDITLQQHVVGVQV